MANQVYDQKSVYSFLRNFVSSLKTAKIWLFGSFSAKKTASAIETSIETIHMTHFQDSGGALAAGRTSCRLGVCVHCKIEFFTLLPLPQIKS